MSSALRVCKKLSRNLHCVVNVGQRRMSSEDVKFFFYEGYNKKLVEVKGRVGKKLLHVALDHGVDIDGVCGGELACSTCHVTVESHIYEVLPEKKENECDMLDLTTGLLPTSRLCCQLRVSENIKDAVFTVPISYHE